MWAEGRERYACHGVTSLDNPLPVDPDTLYLLGSVTKTYTATTLLRLLADGRITLAAPVRHYLPQLRLTDERAAARVTVLQLLNHTAGLDWGLITDLGEGDDALTGYVARLAELGLVAAPGARAAYSQAGHHLAGRLIQQVTGQPFEHAVAALLLAPLGLGHSFFARDDVMTHRFRVGHHPDQHGTLRVAWLWRRSRGDNPGGGLAASAADQLGWARFHLGDGHPPPAPGCYRRRCWVGCRRRRWRGGQQPGRRHRDRLVPAPAGRGRHRGAWRVGQRPGRRAAAGPRPPRRGGGAGQRRPHGTTCNQTIVGWALQAWLGLTQHDPPPLPYDPARAAELVGRYQLDAMTATIASDGTRLQLRSGSSRSSAPRRQAAAARHRALRPGPAPRR